MDVKTIYPTEEEFVNMSQILKRIESDEECQAAGLVKVSIKFDIPN